MTIFRLNVLRAASHHENEGSIEAAMELGLTDGIDWTNFLRAWDWLLSRGFIEASGPTITEKGKRALARTESQAGAAT